ncbi:hypothetical protein ABIB83_008418 [Bradyrhizobium sp. I1.8.5]
MFLSAQCGFWTAFGPQRPSKYEARLASKDNVALAEHGDRRERTGLIASTLTKPVPCNPNRWTSGDMFSPARSQSHSGELF